MLLFVSGCTADATARESPVVAPYVDVVSGTANIQDIHRRTGLTDFTLAFVLADSAGSCTPTWGGTLGLGETAAPADIAAIGGEVIVATGGATGTYLESVCSAEELAIAYAEVLDATGSNHLDVDIEQKVDPDLVTAALASLQQSRDTAISLTLPVEGAGLTEAGLALLGSAKRAGLEVTVNAMTMNFDYDGDWGTAMVEAIRAVQADLATVWPEREIAPMLGVTPMLGVNDTGPVTTLDAARTVLTYAQEQGLGFVRFWSVNRDNGDCADGRLSGACSGISQDEYAFTELFTIFEDHAGKARNAV
ncbi:glycosyl hydrolase [Actinoplanes sp. NBC_00393]|uniref:glycosyl hydrolase n=1 Tax=Actinoplanes sp. NBC_00393 TaxID=2975953 RepID=UPI002E1CEB6B